MSLRPDIHISYEPKLKNALGNYTRPVIQAKLAISAVYLLHPPLLRRPASRGMPMPYGPGAYLSSQAAVQRALQAEEIQTMLKRAK